MLMDFEWPEGSEGHTASYRLINAHVYVGVTQCVWQNVHLDVHFLQKHLDDSTLHSVLQWKYS